MKKCTILALLAVFAEVNACPFLDGATEAEIEDADIPHRTLQAAFQGTAEEAVAAARGDLITLMNDESRLGPKFVRLSFHDCVGSNGCNGCIDLTNIGNSGLLLPMRRLEDICIVYSAQLTRADCWALAGLTALEEMEPTGSVSFPLEYIGRPTCEDGGSLGNSLSDEQFASPVVTTDELLDFFFDEFEFSNEQAVAIMGAHTLGRLSAANSVFPNAAWVPDNDILDNQFFRFLIDRRNADLPTDRYVQEQAANQLFFWERTNNRRNLQRRRGGRGGHRGGRGGGIFGRQGRGDRDRGGGGGGNLIMLNADMALIADLSTSTEAGQVDCQIGSGPNQCANAATFDIVTSFSRDNAEWLQVFQVAFASMVNKGCAPSTCTTGDLCICANAE